MDALKCQVLFGFLALLPLDSSSLLTWFNVYATLLWLPDGPRRQAMPLLVRLSNSSLRQLGQSDYCVQCGTVTYSTGVTVL